MSHVELDLSIDAIYCTLIQHMHIHTAFIDVYCVNSETIEHACTHAFRDGCEHSKTLIYLVSEHRDAEDSVNYWRECMLMSVSASDQWLMFGSSLKRHSVAFHPG